MVLKYTRRLYRYIGRVANSRRLGERSESMSSISILNTPVKIGTVQLKNRFVMPPMDTNYDNGDGTLSRKQYAYYTERARGGVGLIVTEAVSVSHPRGLITERQMNFKSHNSTPEFHDLTDSVHAFGCKIIPQLHHGGFMAIPAYNDGEQSVSASDFNGARAMTTEEVKAVIADFINAALVARDGGFDGVEIHASHMYLINQFLSPACNTRTDEYGGTLENRFRILKEILVGIREVCPQPFILAVRLAIEDAIPGGITLEDGVQYAKWCEEFGADMIDATYGFYTAMASLTESQWQEEGLRVYLSEAVKKEVSVPVAIVGKMRTPEKMAEIVESGKADLIVVGRQLICDPYLPEKVFAGKLDEIRPCLNCNDGCVYQCILSHGNIHCAINPYVGYEDLYNEINVPKAGVPKKVVIVGAGISGLQAGIIATKRGHDVTILEKSDKIAGQMNLATLAPYKAEVAKARDWFVGEAKRTGVQIKTGVEATPDVVAGYKPDSVILATGSTPFTLPIPGADKTLEAWNVLQDKEEMKKGSKVAVIGGGIVGAELSHKLVEEGYDVTIIEMLPEICMGQEPMHKGLLETYLKKNATICVNTRVKEVCDGKVVCESAEGEAVEIPADYTIMSVGQKPVGEELYRGLLEKGISTFKIGDAVRPANFRAATRAALEIAYRI